MSDKIAKKKAELALLELEAEFAEKKESGSVSHDDKLALREARQKFREEHRQPTKDGAQAGTISSKAKVK